MGQNLKAVVARARSLLQPILDRGLLRVTGTEMHRRPVEAFVCSGSFR